MYKIAAEIRAMYEADMVHRKGFRIRAATPHLAAANAVEELGELLVELAFAVRNLDKVKDEMSDVLAVVTHLAMMVEAYDGCSICNDEQLAALEQRAIEKIKRRFSSAN